MIWEDLIKIHLVLLLEEVKFIPSEIHYLGIEFLVVNFLMKCTYSWEAV